MEVERRQKGRLEYSIPVSVRGSEDNGRIYRFQTVARNISGGGLCAFAPRMMRVGERLSLRVRFAHPGSRTPQAPEVLVRGFVVRAENRLSGLCMFAVSFLFRC